MLALLGTALPLLSAAMMVLAFRKSRAVLPGALLLPLAIALAASLAQLLFAPIRPSFAAGFVAFAAGSAILPGGSRRRRPDSAPLAEPLSFIEGDLTWDCSIFWPNLAF